MAYYPFDGDARDYSANKFHGKTTELKFIEDENRGVVAAFEGETSIILPKAEKLSLRNHDFTVAAWVNTNPTKNPDNSILGTTVISYQEGIHLTLRDNKPYFGFWTNDTQGKTHVQDSEWYHIVWRYNKFNGEQSIFVNGRLDNRSLGHPPYQGKEDIIIGDAAFFHKSNYTGLLDDLAIWDRPLSENEVWGLYTQALLIKPSFFLPGFRSILIYSGIVFILAAFALYWFRFKGKSKAKPYNLIKKALRRKENKASLPILVDAMDQSNSIRIFGEFKAFDNLGQDITDEFTPKLKQLFLLLLMYTKSHHKGISTNDLTDIMWPGYDSHSAKNSRGVSIRKLRIILEKMQGFEVQFARDVWKMHLTQPAKCDYCTCLQLLDKAGSGIDKNAMHQIFELVQPGLAGGNESYPWMEEFKSEVDYQVIDILIKYATILDTNLEAELCIAIADRVLLSDPVNEDAIKIKLKALLNQDNIHYARYSFEVFTNTYYQFYSQKYDKSLELLIRNEG
ncbi:MAG: LamG domain-containing protein [Cyclobacteriaceae bacterium]